MTHAIEPVAPSPTVEHSFVRFQGSVPVAVREAVIGEIRFSVYVDGKELVSFMCSPWMLRELVVGFLYIEGFIEHIDDIEMLRICPEDRLADVRLRSGPVTVPERKILTSGCSGGTSFGQYLEDIERFRLADSHPLDPAAVYGAMRLLYERAALYHQARGVHTSVLTTETGVPIVAEDIGRHNTLDKLQGYCLLNNIPTAHGLLVSSGRISSEMLLKSAIMGVPIVGSRTSPTELAVRLAERLNITVIGYIRPAAMNVYTYSWRLTPGAV